MPNADAINGVIASIKNDPESLNMSAWAIGAKRSASCKTVMCIAGHAIHNALDAQVWNDALDPDGYLLGSSAEKIAKALKMQGPLGISRIAAKLLGISSQVVADELFLPERMSEIKEKHAVHMLEFIRDRNPQDPNLVENEWKSLLLEEEDAKS